MKWRLTPSEMAALETLAEPAMRDALAHARHMEAWAEAQQSPYRWSLPGLGGLAASRSAYDQLGLYQRGREPVPGASPLKVMDGRPLYPRHLLRRVGATVTGCDGIVVLSRHQSPDRDLPRLAPDHRGGGYALDGGPRRLRDGAFIYYHDQDPQARELHDEAESHFTELGWRSGRQLWSWDENHFQRDP